MPCDSSRTNERTNTTTYQRLFPYRLGQSSANLRLIFGYSLVSRRKPRLATLIITCKSLNNLASKAIFNQKELKVDEVSILHFPSKYPSRYFEFKIYPPA